MTLSGHGHGGRADHDGTPNQLHQVILNVPRVGHLGTGGKRTILDIPTTNHCTPLIIVML